MKIKLNENESDLSLHNIHPYPCKFPGKVARDYLPSSGLILDPYCGSGTTLLEASMLGLSTVGTDCNPIAVLISKCKLAKPTDKDFLALEKIVADLTEQLLQPTKILFEIEDFDGRDHWFTKQIQSEIGAILQVTNRLKKDSAASLIAKTTLSAITNKISNQDGETRYASVNKNHKPGYAVEYFIKKLNKNIGSFQERGKLLSKSNEVYLTDIKQKIPLPDSIVDCIITSPPYANTMDYYLYHKQRMNILGFEFKSVLSAEIGSRHEFSSKRAPLEKWDADYLSAMTEMNRVMKSGAEAYFVIGDSQIAGQLISGADTTEKAAKKLGLKFKVLESTPMSGRSRSFSSAFQRPNKFEHVIRLIKK